MCVHTAYDHIHITRCTKCCKYGHTAPNCKATKSTCGICAGDHQTLECEGLLDGVTIPKKCSKCHSKDHGANEKNKCPHYLTKKSQIRKVILNNQP